MLDLKAKLLQAGLVTEEQVTKAEAEEKEAREKRSAARNQNKQARGGRGGGPKGGKRPPPDDDERWQRRVEGLAEAPKSEQYDVIRGWVQRTRLDAAKGLPSENAERFHFTKHDGHISWLTLEPAVKGPLSKGEAGIIAFMSHNGLSHCVVPKDVALDVGKIRPEWVRHLDGFDVQTRAPSASEGEGEGQSEGEGAGQSEGEGAQQASQEPDAEPRGADAP